MIKKFNEHFNTDYLSPEKIKEDIEDYLLKLSEVYKCTIDVKYYGIKILKE